MLKDLRRHIMMQVAGGGRLPSEYQEVEYLRGDSASYIDTGILFTKEISIEFDFSYSSGGLFGVGIAFNENALMAVSGGVLYFTYKDLYYIPSGRAHFLFNNREHELIDLNSGVLLKTFSRYDRFVASNTLGLFANHQTRNGVVGWEDIGKGTIYSLKLRNNITDEMLRDFVPCYRKSDNEAGMYDMVNNVFKINAGSGSFIVGPDV